MGSLGRKSLCRKCSIELDIIALFAVDSYSFGGCHKKQPVFAGRCWYEKSLLYYADI